MTVRIKRIYDGPHSNDGYRVLVDRIWPRGVSKEDAKLDEWLKEIAPTSTLRDWYGHDASRFAEFKERYFKELDANGSVVNHMRTIIGGHPIVTLLYAANAGEISNAAALLEYLQR